jgi:hypothetical protein
MKKPGMIFGDGCAHPKIIPGRRISLERYTSNDLAAARTGAAR